MGVLGLRTGPSEAKEVRTSNYSQSAKCRHRQKSIPSKGGGTGPSNWTERRKFEHQIILNRQSAATDKSQWYSRWGHWDSNPDQRISSTHAGCKLARDLGLRQVGAPVVHHKHLSKPTRRHSRATGARGATRLHYTPKGDHSTDRPYFKRTDRRPSLSQ